MAKTWPWNIEGLTLANLKDIDLAGIQQGQTIILSGEIFIPGTAGGGTPGTDGREIELRKGTTHIQWRYVGDIPWIDLVALIELKGETGQIGLQGLQGEQGIQGIQGIQGPVGPSVNDISYFRHYGTTTYEVWFTSPKAGTALAGTALAANRLYAMPFIAPKNITVDQIGIYVSTLSTLTARLGIYSNGGNCYPGSLLLDAGTVSVTTTGAKKIAINQVLTGGMLYWLVIVCAATPAIYCIPIAAVIGILGHSNALGTAQNAGLYASFAYGALPGTFPASPTMITAAPIPAIFLRLNA